MSITKQYLLWLFIFPIIDSCSHFSGYFYTTRKDITVSTISLIREETLTLWSNLELSFQGSLLLSSQNHPMYLYSMFEVNPFYIWQAKERERGKKKGQFSWILSLQTSALSLLTGSATTGPTLTSSVQFSSVTQSCLTLCDPMNHSTPGFPVQHQLPEFTQTHVHRVGDAIQPSHPLSSLSPPAPNPSQHQSLFQ